ncbi:hypothetical protein Ae201684P_013796 [Aphanomyces euteiches]|uniref:Cyclic nucleotide-binding domain-containing protein n=1 Tax=Aphanomyces euteiches TaxID=100861 RepID=A0A6G0WLJ3_9STRA|nr:hypothetical protein Ae201684_013993 [Aphanomyces euteiches]KAH9082892.1 hypothetical protein Ae201684P_013796 [Aphanomyces euteiches]KAH9156940.1 hypothetical protein AeRB84_001186 [Aphanomyces euteiches]
MADNVEELAPPTTTWAMKSSSKLPPISYGKRSSKSDGQLLDTSLKVAPHESDLASPQESSRRRRSSEGSLRNVVMLKARQLSNRMMSKAASRRDGLDAGELEQELNNLAANYVSQLAQQHRAFVLSIHSRTKVFWDIVLAVVTAYAIIVVPMDLTFDLYDTYDSLVFVQISMDVIFLADILLVFRTSYLVSDSREEVFDVDRIRRHYLATWFSIDCMASIPSSALGQAFRESDFAYLRLLVVCRVIRLSALPMFGEIMAWASRTLTPYAVRLAVVIVLYLLLHHYIACSFYYVVRIEGGPDAPDVWVMPFRSNDTLAIKYLSSFYRGLDCTSGSDLGPQTNIERMWSTTAFTVGIIANACVAGIVSSIMAQMNKIEDERAYQKECIGTRLRNCNAGEMLQKRVRDFYDSAHGLESAHHADDLFRGMPEKLHFELSIALNESFLNKVPLFRTLEPEGIVALMECVEETVAMAGDMIIRAGEEGRAMYMIKLGSVEVFLTTATGPRVSIKHMHVGQSFGEMSLMTKGKTTANVVATTFCVLLVIYKEMFDWITRENDQVRTFWEKSRERQMETSVAAKKRVSLETTSHQVVQEVGVVRELVRRAMPRQIKAVIQKIRLRRAAKRIALVRRTQLMSVWGDTQSRQPKQKSFQSVVAKMRATSTFVPRDIAFRAMRMVDAMSQNAAKDMVAATNITRRNILYNAR